MMCFLPFAIEVEMTGRPNEATSHQAKPVVQVHWRETIGEDWWCILSYKDDTKITYIIVGVGSVLCGKSLGDEICVWIFSEKSGKSGRDTICNSAFKVGWCFLWKWYWIDGRWLVEARSEKFCGISCTFLPHFMDRNRKGMASVFRSSDILM